MTALAEYYADREPVEVFRFAGHERSFVTYEQEVVDEIVARAESGVKAETLYKETCAKVLAGDPAIRVLPTDSPQWLCTNGKWRPNEEPAILAVHDGA
jgi:hypothetical protein